MGKKQQQQSQQRNELPPPAAPTTTAPRHVKEEPTYLPLYARPTDVVFSLVYMFLWGSALFSLYAGCRGHGHGIRMGKFFDPVCEQAHKVELDVPLALYQKWQKDVYTAPTTEFMHLTYCVVNLIFALPLALVMLFGASGNNWQKSAILHASVLAVVNGYALAQGWEAKQAKRDVFQAAYVCLAVMPGMLLFRWWGDICFAAESYRGTAVVSFVIKMYALVALAMVMITVYEWTIVSHPALKDFKSIPVQQYQETAVNTVNQVGQVVLDKANELLDQYAK